MVLLQLDIRRRLEAFGSAENAGHQVIGIIAVSSLRKILAGGFTAIEDLLE